jgi:hypothetical protein
MDINKAAISLLSILVIYGTYYYWTIPQPLKMNALTPWGEQVGRSKQIQSKTGDASLFIQKSRRNATKNGGYGRNFMEAAIDYHFISRVCICPIEVSSIKCCCGAADGGSATVGDTIYDGGNADIGGFNFDGGNA